MNTDRVVWKYKNTLVGRITEYMKTVTDKK